jgi:hypothetical protein
MPHNFSTRRVVSDPVAALGARTKFLDTERVKVRFRSRSVVTTLPFFDRSRNISADKDSFESEVVHESTQLESPGQSEGLLSPDGHSSLKSSAPKQTKDPLPLASDSGGKHVLPLEVLKDKVIPLSQTNRREDNHQLGHAPIGVTRPVPLNTLCLVPQTQKVNRGQLVILPSRSLLVDFREGERRQGRPGAEVLLINHDGRNVSVH